MFKKKLLYILQKIEKKKYIKKARQENFNMWQIEEIKNGFKNGLSIQDVKQYADIYAIPRLTNLQMKTKRISIQIQLKSRDSKSTKEKEGQYV